MQIHWRNPGVLEDAVRTAAEERILKLAGDRNDLIDIWIDVAREAHHRHGAESVTIRCQARGAELVAHGRDAQTRLALRDALRAFAREVKDLRARRTDRRVERPATPPLRGVVDRVLHEEGYGFVLTEGGEQVYFHRNAVGDGLSFEDLAEGQSVTLNVEPGEEGPQATVVARALPGAG